jgi:hypothetical protein
MSRRYMELDQALTTIRRKGVFLHYDAERGLDLWTPGVPVPITLRRAIVKHRQELLTIMAQGDARACPSPMLHKNYTRNGRICEVCRSLAI